MRPFFKSGSWNAICDVCGFKYKSDQLQLRWDGLRVCSKDWELRHPQTLIRIPTDDPSTEWVRPQAPYPTNVYACSIFNSVGISGNGISGCSVAGRSVLTG